MSNHTGIGFDRGHERVVCVAIDCLGEIARTLRPGGLLIVDEEKVETSADFHGIKIPVARIAHATTGKTITANTVALGVLVGLTDLVSRAAIEKAITARAPKGTEEMNRKALQAGFAAAEMVKSTA